MTLHAQNEIPSLLVMKLPVLLTTLLLAGVGASQAGSFGGPGPFSDQSPLQSGINGSYQATARGTNLTGIIRFAYQNGVQSPIATANTYAFFVNGNTVTGNVTASITGKSLAGVLGGQDFTVPTNDTGATELPLVFIVRGNRASGYFNGKIDLEDSMSAFNGNGAVTGAPNETNTVIVIPDPSTAVISGAQPAVTITNFIVPGGSLDPDPDASQYKFTFEGVRTSVTAQGSGGGTTTTN